MIKKIIIAVIVIAAVGYSIYRIFQGNQNETRYVSTAVEKGTLIVSVSGSGQVSASDQVDIKSKSSGDVIYVEVKNGQEVKAGTLIAQLDTRDAQKAVSDAEINLANAQLALKDIKGEAEESLSATYEDGLNVLTNTFKDLSSMMPELKKMFSGSSYGGKESDIDYYLNLFRAYNNKSSQLFYWAGGHPEEKYLNIQAQIETIRKGYWVLNKTSPYDQTETILNQTYDNTKTFLDLVRQTFNLVQKYQVLVETENLTTPIPAAISSSQFSQLTEFTSSLINYVDSLSSIKSSLVDKKEALAKADVDMEEQDLTLKQAEYALSDVRETLSQHYIYVPFDGIITEVNSDIKKGDSISANTVLATLITKEKIAEITLNEIDVAKIKIGQKANVTFDAIEGLNITGEVAEIDTLGTVSQGVVTYGVKIAFDTQDERVKPGMSVSVAIITDLKQDALLVPNSAVKSEGDTKYVEVLVNNAPQQRSVETGLSNDTMTEILNGLKEGEQVVTQTITANSTNTSQTQSQTGFRIPGFGGGR